MAKQNNFKVFNENPTSNNTLNDTEYISNSHRKNGVVSGVADSKVHNKLFRQTSMMTFALASYIANQNLDAVDDNVEVLNKNLEIALSVPLKEHREKSEIDHPDGAVTTPKIRDKNVTMAKLADDVQHAINNVLQRAYPVGAIYMSTTSTAPSTLFGFGVWEALPGGRMLLAQGNGYSAGSQGGAATHTLTIAEMPSHSHGWNTRPSGGHSHSGTTSSTGNHNHGSGLANIHADAMFNGRYGNDTRYGVESSRDKGRFAQNATSSNGNHNHNFNTSTNGEHSHPINLDGGGQAHNNMPPYLAVYMWKRVR